MICEILNKINPEPSSASLRARRTPRLKPPKRAFDSEVLAEVAVADEEAPRLLKENEGALFALPKAGRLAWPKWIHSTETFTHT